MATTVQAVSETHSHSDTCCLNIDEGAALNAVAPISYDQPLYVTVLLLWAVLLLVFVPLLPRGAMMSGRDGPIRVRPLHSRLIRASLPHRAPPVLLF